MTERRGGTAVGPTMAEQAMQPVAVLSDPRDEAGLLDEWRELAAAQGNGFTTPEWYRAYERHYGAEAPPFVVRVRDADGSLAGLLPLCRDASGRRESAQHADRGAELDPGSGKGPVRFAGANLGDRFAPVAAPGREAEVAGRASAALGRAGLVLHNVDVDADWVETLALGLPRRAGATRLRGSRMPYVELAGHTWEGFLGERSRNFRSQVRRKERALLDKHGARVRRTSEPGEVVADVAAFYRLHAARWADREGGSTITKPTVQAFLTDFAASALERGWLRLSLLEVPAGDAAERRSTSESQPAVDGGFVAVAALFAWRIGGRYAYYQAGFDPDWHHASVGLVLMAHTVREAIEEGAQEYDLLLGDEEYKFRFATAERSVETLVVAGPLDRQRVMAGLETQVRRVTDSLSPEVRSKLRDAAGPVLSRMPGTRKR